MAGRESPCKWIERDDEGRPRCEHGWAFKAGLRWRCPEKHTAAEYKYSQSDKGRARKARWNHSPWGRSSKAMYEMTRVRERLR